MSEQIYQTASRKLWNSDRLNQDVKLCENNLVLCKNNDHYTDYQDRPPSSEDCELSCVELEGHAFGNDINAELILDHYCVLQCRKLQKRHKWHNEDYWRFREINESDLCSLAEGSRNMYRYLVYFKTKMRLYLPLTICLPRLSMLKSLDFTPACFELLNITSIFISFDSFYIVSIHRTAKETYRQDNISQVFCVQNYVSSAVQCIRCLYTI